MGFVLTAEGSQHDMVDGPIWRVPDIVGNIVGSSVVFAKPPSGQYTVEQTVAGIVDGKIKTKSMTKTVVVGLSPIPPGPTPPAPPAPTPEPTLPAGRFNLAKFSYDAAMQVPQPARAKAPSVAAAFGGVASAVSAKQIVDKASAGLACKQKLAEAIGADAAAWQVCKTAVVNEFNRLEGAGKILTIDDLAAAFFEIEMGVKQAK